MQTFYPAHRPVSASEARALDLEASERFGIPSGVLMEHAALGLASLVAAERPSAQPVTVLCGPGNNGGDGYGCARFLAGWGIPIRVVRCAPTPPASGDAAFEHDLAAREVEISVAGCADDLGVVDRAIDGAGLLVDALFGVGLSRPLAPPYPLWIERMNASSAKRLAVDVPSGLSSDVGVPLPVAVRAHVTAAMGIPKRGCVAPSMGAAYAGRVVEIDIGLPASIHRRFLAVSG